MTLLNDIKVALLAARKARQSATASSLSTLVGEAEMIGKNDGNRPVTDSEVMALVKKFIKNVEESHKVASSHGNAEAAERLLVERDLYASFLPSQLTGEALLNAIAALCHEVNASSIKDMGKVMKLLKERHDGQFDGAAASTFIKAQLA